MALIGKPYGFTPSGNPSMADLVMEGVDSGPTPPPDTGGDEGQAGYTVDDLLPGIQHYESGGRRFAVSPKGAIGLYQIMPSTAAMYGYSPEDMFDPAKNEDVARRYLGGLLNQYNGNGYLALAAYNAGPGTVNRGAIPPETVDYVHNVLGFTGAKGAGQKIRQRASIAGRDVSPRMDTTGDIDPSFRGTPVNQIFNRYGRITGDEPGYGQEQSLGTIPQRPMATIEQGMQKVGPALGSLFDPIGKSLSNAALGLGNYFKRTPVSEVLPDPGETIS